MLNFCTLFNSVYLSRGLALYESLKEHCSDFHLYIFTFDDATYNFFKDNNFDYITPISLKEFEDKELLRVKPTRTKGEYCWTCTSSTILYVLNHFEVDHCTYIDADLYFFSSPQVLIDEMGDASILLTEHRYTKEYDQTATSGKYCVQFVLFKNDERGRSALTWWRERCLEWCYNRMEDGKFGDQKYLDDWIERFEGVYILKHLGGGVAPWNMQQYTFHIDNGMICGYEIASGSRFYLIFFHFHALFFVSPTYFSPSEYKITDECYITVLLRRYVKNIVDIRKKYSSIINFEHYKTILHRISHFLYMFRFRNMQEIKCLLIAK